MLPPHPPHARRARTPAPPVRSSRGKLAFMQALATLLETRSPSGLRVLGRPPHRAGKPGLKVLRKGDAPEC